MKNSLRQGGTVDLGLKGCKALVCASTKGIGWATARCLAEEGARVVINGRDQTAVESKAKELPGSIGIAEDISTAEGALRLAEKAERELSGIDILVLNGPGPKAGPAVGQDVNELRQALESLIVAHATLLQALLPGMRDREWGRVIAISSSSVQAPLDNLALSNIGRPGLTALLKTLANEITAEGVTLNTVIPGRIATDRVRQVDEATARRRKISPESVLEESVQRIPARRLGQPDEIAATVAFLASKHSGYISGTALRVDGGLVPVL